MNTVGSTIRGWRRSRRWRAPTALLGVASVAALLGALTLARGVVEAQGAAPLGPREVSIFGAWKANCENAHGMVVELKGGQDQAEGRIKVLGKAEAFRYTRGELIFRLGREDSRWSGQFLWKNTTGAERWQPITFVFDEGRLHGKTDNEHCYEYMERAD